MAQGPDFATFNVPQGLANAAAAERQAKVPKVRETERQRDRETERQRDRETEKVR